MALSHIDHFVPFLSLSTPVSCILTIPIWIVNLGGNFRRKGGLEQIWLKSLKRSCRALFLFATDDGMKRKDEMIAGLAEVRELARMNSGGGR
jgi:hypothetical protein